MHPKLACVRPSPAAKPFSIAGTHTQALDTQAQRMSTLMAAQSGLRLIHVCGAGVQQNQ
jgi:hypothetical protein